MVFLILNSSWLYQQVYFHLYQAAKITDFGNRIDEKGIK